MTARVLARVFLPQGKNVRLPTTPGRSVQFFGGMAQVTDNRDMPHVLQMAEARVQPEADAMSWAFAWLSETDKIRAEVEWPEKWSITHTNREEFEVHGPGYDMVKVEPDSPSDPDGPPPDPDALVDLTSRGWDSNANKGTPGAKNRRPTDPRAG